MARKPKEPSIEELKKDIWTEFERWNHAHKHGTDDPFWPDGTNMNLVRNHIIYAQHLLKEACDKAGVKCPMEANLKLPREVRETYMAKGSKAAKNNLEIQALLAKRKSK